MQADDGWGIEYALILPHSCKIPNRVIFWVLLNQLIRKPNEKYVGEWIGGRPTGQGTQTYYDGENYVGLFKDGKYHGQGTYTFSDGGKFVGEWKDDNRWNGIRYDKNGNITYKVVNGKWNRTITPP